MNVLIVEDEPHAQNELKRLLSRVSDEIHVLECIDSIEDAVDWLNSNPNPDLMFLDIQLSDGLSFEIFNQVDLSVPVIFTTAYDEYAIRAFQVNSIDYLLKPVKTEDLKKALGKFETLSQQRGNRSGGLSVEQIKQLFEIHAPKYKSRFIARVGDQIKHVDVDEVAYFRADDNEVFLVTKDNSRLIIDYSLDQLTGLLDPAMFFRVNRRYITTPACIDKISKYFNSRLHLELRPATEDTVLISRVRVPEFLEWMDK